MSKRILVVDDINSNRLLACALLKRAGWETEEAADGNRALEILTGEHGFQAVLLDISMPGINGDEVCGKLRANPATAGLPIVAYTAHALEEDGERLLASGFDALLIKPISVAALHAALEKAIAQRA
jgi:CheY-like chemotaxis protein